MGVGPTSSGQQVGVVGGGSGGGGGATEAPLSPAVGATDAALAVLRRSQ